ncbi:unnamed protein product [Ilex paraguariensis]|uniref:Uncharacterized protein n=1 Tax=Ilex paraguariensis TaxID=185542 RepID=A0ABC8SS39_9AQUA
MRLMSYVWQPYFDHSVLVSSTSQFSVGHGKSMCKVLDLFRMPALKHKAELEEWPRPKPYRGMSKERTLEFWWCHLNISNSPAIATPLRKCTHQNEEMVWGNAKEGSADEENNLYVTIMTWLWGGFSGQSSFFHRQETSIFFRTTGMGVSTSYSLFDDSARKLNNPENDSREKERPGQTMDLPKVIHPGAEIDRESEMTAQHKPPYLRRLRFAVDPLWFCSKPPLDPSSLILIVGAFNALDVDQKKEAFPWVGKVVASSLSFSRFRYRIVSLGERCRSSPFDLT